MKDKSIRPEISVLKFEHMNLAKLKQKHLDYEINAANYKSYRTSYNIYLPQYIFFSSNVIILWHYIFYMLPYCDDLQM